MYDLIRMLDGFFKFSILMICFKGLKINY